MISSRDISASQRLKSSLLFFRYFLHVRNFAKKFKYSEESFGAFFDTTPPSPSPCLVLELISELFLVCFLIDKVHFLSFHHWFDFLFEIFLWYKFHSLFFGFENLIFSLRVELVEKVLAFPLKLDLE